MGETVSAAERASAPENPMSVRKGLIGAFPIVRRGPDRLRLPVR